MGKGLYGVKSTYVKKNDAFADLPMERVKNKNVLFGVKKAYVVGCKPMDAPLPLGLLKSFRDKIFSARFREGYDSGQYHLACTVDAYNRTGLIKKDVYEYDYTVGSSETTRFVAQHYVSFGVRNQNFICLGFVRTSVVICDSDFNISLKPTNLSAFNDDQNTYSHYTVASAGTFDGCICILLRLSKINNGNGKNLLLKIDEGGTLRIKDLGSPSILVGSISLFSRYESNIAVLMMELSATGGAWPYSHCLLSSDGEIEVVTDRKIGTYSFNRPVIGENFFGFMDDGQLRIFSDNLREITPGYWTGGNVTPYARTEYGVASRLPNEPSFIYYSRNGVLMVFHAEKDSMKEIGQANASLLPSSITSALPYQGTWFAAGGNRIIFGDEKY